ncbi:hypothetical protein [Clostridioides difficile]|uniref:hypothetical protein n=1 Tax=Clostridioides difficile TaxID=1496 RepID=UPI001C162476|nr:hypothetical protein [Clostridioides difficile]HBF6291369.1 hypothetical protein [Clostridioides difficile]HBG4071401.1 hypothetical protein [Clostridioides difficile]HBY2690097.1 hypothetical protein [Clostridioides difficile]HDO9121449.1 hypothetical protein [Clostridioides difficile]
MSKSVSKVKGNGTLKITKKALNKLVDDMCYSADAIGKFEDDVEIVENRLKGLRNELEALQLDNDRMANGSVKMDAIRFIKNRQDISVLNDKIEQSENDLKAIQEALIELEDVSSTTAFMDNIHEVTAEFRANRYTLVNEMFCKMMEVVELSEQLSDLSKEYKNTVQGTGHSKAHCYGFDTGTSAIWNRFILNGFGAKYSQHITSQIQEFEEKYFDKK